LPSRAVEQRRRLDRLEARLLLLEQGLGLRDHHHFVDDHERALRLRGRKRQLGEGLDRRKTVLLLFDR